jgi:hypothetical protein
MAGERAKTIAGGCLGGLTGAFLGVLIGGYISDVTNDRSSRPVEIKGGGGNAYAEGAEMAFGFAAALGEASAAIGRIFVGAGIGGIIGGIGGSVLCASLAARATSTEPPAESPDAELARLKDRVAELEAQNRPDDRFKEG